MRGFFTLLLSLCSLIVSATDYYVSSAGNDSANGLSSTTPWKSISKVNSASSGFMPGDRILFNRGNTFVGTIKLSRSGASGNPITIGAYGTGANPIISGFASLSGWISNGGGIYYKALSCETTPNIVSVNGVNTPIGRWPNTEFLSIDSHVSNTSITDSELPSSPNWTGAEVVIRKASQIWDRNKITNHSGTSITYTSGSYYSAQDGYGYFIQNDIKTLDRQGEWFHNGSNFYMYFGTSSPENYTVKVGVVDQLVNLEGINYITIEGISFEGANSYAIQIRNSGYITVQNCNFNFTGKTTIYGPWDGDSPYCKILNNTIRNSNSIGIKLVGDHTNATVTGNRIENSGIIVGMGESGDEKYNAINAIADNIVVSNNIIENTGYIGVHFGGNNAVISNNYINNFGLTKNDGGGIYTWIGTGTPNVGQKITGNIIMNGIGFGEGTPKLQGHSLGIYLDERVRNVLVSNNSISNCCSSGLYLHNAHEIEITGNTFFNNGSGRPDLGSQVLFVHDTHSPDDPIRNVKMNNNILFSKTALQKVFAFSTADNDISQFGSADYNYYARPLDDNQVITTWAAGWNGAAVKRTLADWQSYSGQDKNSKKSPVALTDANKIRFEYNASTSNKVVSLDGSYIDVKGAKYSGSITLAPYTSAVLMVDPNPSAPPAVPVYVSSAIENTAPSVIEMTYNLSLANIVPAASAFTVQVNSTARTVSSVSVSGTKVLLTLSSPVAYGNTVTVAYTKPSSNPLQTSAGGQAATISAQSVTNRIAAPAPPAVPVYVSSSIENTAPSVIEMTYNLALANVVPAASAFTVQVNSTSRTVSSVSVSGTKVLLTLSSPVAYGNTVAVAYTKPSTNPLQTSAGGQAATISAQSVTNRIAAPAAPAVPAYVSSEIKDAARSVIEMTYNLSLANIVPATSAFSVQVNSTARSVSSVSVSGTKVLLTLSSPVAYGNTVTVAYTKPSTNPLQTSSGGQAATISAQSVTNRIAAPAPPAVPAYTSSEIKDAARSVIEMTYNLSLANVVPAASAFTVQVNSTARTVSSVSVSGTKVLLTLSSPVAYGNTVTVAYTKPSTNPLQTSAGGQAATISAQSVTNRIAAPPAPAVPVYVSSVIENTAPSVIEITYSLALANKVPAGSAFTVQVNSTARSVSSVSVSGTKVLLTLSGPVAYGNTVTVAYTKPSTNPLQTSAGGQAATISAQSVTNRVSQPAPPPVVVTPPPVVPNTQPVPVVKFPDRTYSGFIGEINASGSYDADKDKLSFSWNVPAEIPVSSTNTEVLEFLAPLTETNQTYEFILTVSDGKTTQSRTIPITVVPYEPDLEIAEVISVTASDSYSNNQPYNIIDGNIGTMWSSKGEEQSLTLELKSPFIIQHIKIAFLPGQKMECYFDIYGSNDGETWESILVKAKSCSFSGGIHVFEFPISKAINEFKYLKIVGLGNSNDTWNYISEFRIFGYRQKNRADYEDLIVKLYPNPAREIVNIKIDNAEFNPDFIRILTLDGKVMYSDIVDPMVRDFQVPVNFTHGVYIVQMGMGNITMFTQKLVVFR